MEGDKGMPGNHIAVYMAPGEGAREDKLRAALQGDGRFKPLEISSSNVVDLQFSVDVDEEEKS